jgi:hypothetical protein
MPNVPEQLGQIVESALADGSVTTVKIASEAVTTPKAKPGAEPAMPAEGEVTKGAVGVGKRQTFRYKGSEVEEVILLHDLETQWVTAAVFSATTGQLYLPGVGFTLKVIKSGEVKLEVVIAEKPFKKAEESVIVLTA